MELDKRQEEILGVFKEIILPIPKKHFFSFITDRFTPQMQYAGIYLHGDVGRGKTVLMQNFFEINDVSKQIIHFQKFILRTTIENDKRWDR